MKLFVVFALAIVSLSCTGIAFWLFATGQNNAAMMYLLMAIIGTSFEHRAIKAYQEA